MRGGCEFSAPPHTMNQRMMTGLSVLTVATLLCVLVTPAGGQVLTPPYFNLAVGRRIKASATCGVGVSDSELYCKLVGANTDKQDNPNINLIQGQVCDYCNAEGAGGDPEMAHPPHYAIDGTERWWQSPPLSRGTQYNEVNLTIDLGQEYHVAYVFIKMANSPRPGIWALERSTDNGKTYKPWQYFADTESDCVHLFGKQSVQSITEDDSVVCETKFSKVVPLEGGEIVVSLLNDRPNAKNFSHSKVLQEWTKATNIKLHFLRTKTLLGHLMSVARQDPTVTRRYFYSIKDISIGGRCVCNGHANTCDITDPEDPYKLLCQCQHHTCGPQCESCCPGYVQKKWRRATYQSENECEACNCFGHSESCIYDEAVDQDKLSIDIHGKYDGGGVCQNCRDNTQGINCNECKPGYYRLPGKLLNATDVCQECDCDYFYSTGSCAPNTGNCECNEAFLAPDCDECNLGYYGYPDCRPCDCNVNGTYGDICEVGGGQCPCKINYEGKNCEICKEGFYGFPECNACDCDSVGSLDEICDIKSGQCGCITNYGGRDCGQCAVGWYNYPNCDFCNCDSAGTTDEVCNNQTGKCICKEGYGGDRCDQCAPSYYGYPNCMECGCNEKGSSSVVCSTSGQCRCLNNFSGRQCNQCTPGFFNYPECTACNCDFTGSIGISCNEQGTCTCKKNFHGNNCNKCKEGFYNYPLCEECNCDPAGIIATFGGCGSLTDGLLCECKERVTGRICNTCKPLYWDLRANNPLGCQDCDCHQAGTVGGLRMCDSTSGQCMCKPNVQSRRCDTCSDGTYQLEETNLFGCQDCGCNVGGSVNNKCDKTTGQCMCRPRITGLLCDKPLKLHYFPTLYQHQYELEEGKTPSGSAVRYSYDNNVFPNYSWKGYAVFSQLQNEVLVEIVIDKPSLYHIILRYVNINNGDAKGEVRLIPEASGEVPQANSVIFAPTTNAVLHRVNSPSGVPVPFVLNPGRWTISVSADNVYIDYIVLLPSAFYEATLLQESINTACTLSSSDNPCRRFRYPVIDSFITVRGEAGYIGINATRTETQKFDDQKTLDELDSGVMVLLNENQTQLQMDVKLEKAGPHVYLVLYHTITDGEASNDTATVNIDIASENQVMQGQSILYECKYNMLCRQAVADLEGRIAVVDSQSDFASIKLSLNNSVNVIIHSIVAIPEDDWNEEYLVPQSTCIQVNGKCRNTTAYEVVPNSIKIEFETSEHRESSQELPEEIYDINVKLVKLANNDSMVDIRGSVPKEGDYVFIVHYYQPYHPNYDVDVLIQNGQFYEATMPVPFCPSNTGCRTVLKKKLDQDNRIRILKNFMLTLNNGAANKNLWVDYVLVVPADEYKTNMLEENFEDRAGKFITECSQDNFRLSLNATDYCKKSTFSLTSEYNNGALPCACNIDGSLSFECDEFGGQCQCKPNILGRTCSECATGFHGFPACKPCSCPSTAICHHVTGKCICPSRVTGAQCDTCKPLTYGFDPIIGCEECNCNPLGVANGELQCDQNTGKCPCKPNVVGRKCDKCAAGYWAYPDCQLCECDLRGTTDEICDQDNSRCYCKENVYGASCDKCRPGTFYLEEKNYAGCTKCFCFGATDRCRSALMYVVQVADYEGWNGTALNMDASSINVVEDVNMTVNLTGATIHAQLPDKMPDGTFFFITAPPAYLGNRVTSYGGKLRYSVSYEVDESSPGGSVIGPDVILVGNNITIMHEHLEQPSGNYPFRPEIPFLETEFSHLSGSPVTREQFMVVLAGLESLYIRGLYYQPTEEVRISEIMLDIAEKGPIADAPQALEVENCQCPQNYRGSSCEECAPGYYRSRMGPHLGFCVPCQCHGHASTCDVNTGKCIDCKHDTTGDHCEQCVAGYYGDATQGTVYDCMICVCPLPYPSNNFATSCEVSPSGKAISCECKEGYYGPSCDVCSAGYFGRPDIIGGDCQPCQCSGNINATNPGSCDSQTGDCLLCLHNTEGTACNYCAAGYYGDAIINKDCKQCSCDECGTKECDNEVGICKCQPNVIGENCDKCADEHWGLRSCLGCRACGCGAASHDKQCNVDSGQCECKPGVTGLRCDICEPGFWNYGDEGCQHCNCDEIYSAGAVCDPTSGQCQCLPGVIGDKCDHCPWRWVLITDQGCQECGPCIHSLLDDTDMLANILDPALADLEGASSSFFAYKRLDHVNTTLHELSPLVVEYADDPNKMDLGPLKSNIETLEEEGVNVKQTSNQVGDKANTAVNDANKVHAEALRVEVTLLESIKRTSTIVKSILELAVGLEEDEAIADDDKLIAQAERILTEIENKNFSANINNTENEKTLALHLLETVQQFLFPALENKAYSLELNIKLRRLNTLLDELTNRTNTAVSNNNFIVDINNMNKKSADLISGDKINEHYKKAEKLVIEGGKNNEDAQELLNEMKEVLAKMNDSSEQLQIDADNLQNFTSTMIVQLNETEALVVRSTTHAKSLSSHVSELDRLLDDTQDTSKLAVQAATAYQGIKAAIMESLEAANGAISASMQAQNMSLGTTESATDSLNISIILKTEAESAATKVDGDLLRSLQLAKSSASTLRSSVTTSSNNLAMVKNGLGELRTEVTTIAGTAINVSAAANDLATTSRSNILVIQEKLPGNLRQSETVKSDIVEANEGVKRAAILVDRVSGLVPNMKKLVTRSEEQKKRINIIGTNIGLKVAELKRKVALARDQVKRIEVGAKFQGNTSIQLRNPENLQQAATYTHMSFYFRTKQTDGLITYVGNEIGTHKRLKRMLTDDFMAVEVSGGKAYLTIDLGSGPVKLVNDKFIADNEWHRLIVERTGNTATLTIKTEGQEDSVASIVLRGTNIVFNLDQKESKFYVGGFSTTTKIQKSVQTRYFTGDIQGLEFGKNLLGFWNFVESSGFSDGSRERDKLVILEKSTGMKFDGTGYSVLQSDGNDVKTQTDIFLNFKSYSKNALIVLLTNSVDSFFSVALNDGSVQLKYNLGDGTTKLTTVEKLNDGNWHNIEVSRAGQEAIIKVNKRIVARRKGAGSKTELIVDDKIYIAGYPGDHGMREVETEYFEGCIDELYIAASLYDLNENVESLGAITGCPASVARTVSFTEDLTGYVAMPNINIENFLQLSFKFKTLQPSALLFFTANFDQSSSFAVSLLEGSVVVRSRPGGEVQTSTDTLYNDSQWHYVMITKADKKLRIDVDDYNFVIQELSEEPITETSTPMYFGGVPDSYEINLSTAPSVKSFVGCLGDTTINGRFQNFADTLDRPGASLASCPLGTTGVTKVPTTSTATKMITQPITTVSPTPEIEITMTEQQKSTTEEEEATTEEPVTNTTITEEPATNATIIEETEEPATNATIIKATEEPVTTEEPPSTTVEEETTVTEEMTTEETTTEERETTTEDSLTTMVEFPTEDPTARQCSLPLIPHEDTDIPAEGEYRLGNKPDSRLEYDFVQRNIRDVSEFSMQFKTKTDSGILFYVGGSQQIDFMAVFLHEGKVNYYFNCGSGTAKIVSQNTYNDGKWHTIVFSRHEKNGKLVVDTDDKVEGSSLGVAKWINIKAPFYFGGLSHDMMKLTKNNVKGITNVFNGCIRDIRQERYVFGKPSRKVSVTGCSNKVEPGSFFSANGGYIQMYDKFRVGLDMDITINIKPRNLSGVILAIHGRRGDYLLLQLLNGNVKFTVNNGAGPITVTYFPSIDNYLCDGQWHRLQAVKTKNVVTLSVDGMFVEPGLGVAGISSTDTNDPLYLGGMPKVYEGELPEGVETVDQFVGCISNIEFDSKKERLQKARVFGDVTFGYCPTI